MIPAKIFLEKVRWFLQILKNDLRGGNAIKKICNNFSYFFIIIVKHFFNSEKI